ncbi:hypothetical protein AB3M89_13265 [Microbacterium sp. 179-I 3D2 NHS]|uniref:hypothetical protein n=1 Tax=Microbacterium sp. 179-I 3D2 NHS TaxID=3235178 RepID=UPI0039A28C24
MSQIDANGQPRANQPAAAVAVATRAAGRAMREPRTKRPALSTRARNDGAARLRALSTAAI